MRVVSAVIGVRTRRHLESRITALEREDKRALDKAELDWVRGIVADLHTGALSWTKRELARHRARYETPEPASATRPSRDVH